MKPKLLDLYCKAGGCSVGYAKAGFDVVGVDKEPQPNYPFEFIQSDAIEYLNQYHHLYDIIHASPPCQLYSKSTASHRLLGKKYPDLLAPTRKALDKTNKPYIIENVQGAPLRHDIILSGEMFGLKVIRYRFFELGGGLFMMQPGKPQIKRGMVKNGERISVYGNGHYRDKKTHQMPIFKKNTVNETWAYAMGIDWPMTNRELAEAIPPSYTYYIGINIISQVMK